MNQPSFSSGNVLETTSFGLHLTAMACMLCDHLWGTFCGSADWLGYLGRIAFPIFAFLLVEGFFHTGDRKKYLRRMLVFAVISEIPFNLMIGHVPFFPIHQNVLWAFAEAIAMLQLLEKARERFGTVMRAVLSVVIVFGFFLLGIITFVDYYGYGILMVALFYFTRLRPDAPPLQKILRGLVQLAVMYWINCEMMAGLVLQFDILGLHLEFHKQGLALLALIPIWLYRGRQGPYNRAIKAVYYWFYPVHLLILGGLIAYL